MTDPLRVVLADDHAALRAGVRAVLEADGFEVVAEVGDADAAVAACVALGPDLCLLDIDMPGNGIVACRAVRERCLHVVPVMLTESTDDRDLFDALQAGACGYLLKTTSAARFGEALRGVMAGEAAIPRTLVTKLIAELRNRRGRRFQLGRDGDRLSEREWDVLELLADGLDTKQIADRLFLSAITVRSHTNAIIRKLGVADRQAVIDLVRSEDDPSPVPRGSGRSWG